MSAIFVSRMRTTFYLFDRNKDGFLTKKEMFDQQSKSYDTKEQDSVPMAVSDGWDVLVPSGRLNFEQFLQMHIQATQNEKVRKIYETVYEGLFKAQFVAIDTNKNGVISLEEYEAHILKFWGNKPNYKEIALNNFTAIDTNHDGKISLEEHMTWAYKYWLTDDPSDPVEMWGWLLSEDDWNKYHNK